MIEIDGSHGEGGGSILRQALALSLITKKPFRIINIRANRSKPGLNYQHLASIVLAQKVSDSKVTGANLGSQTIEFYPKDLSAKEITLDIGSAGSIVLSLQSVILPCLVSAKKFKFNISGGTDVSFSPTIDYFKEIFLPCLEHYGKFEIQIDKRGYFPKGRGSATLTILGNNKEMPFRRDSLGQLIAIKGIINTSKSFWHNYSAEKINNLTELSLSGLNVKVDILNYSSFAEDEGASILFYAVFENLQKEDKFIRVGVSEIAKDEDELILKIETEALKLKKLITNKVPVDECLADQLISLIGLFGGKLATSNITNHIKSNIYLTELFLDKKFEIDEKNKIISC